MAIRPRVCAEEAVYTFPDLFDIRVVVYEHDLHVQVGDRLESYSRLLH